MYLEVFKFVCVCVKSVAACVCVPCRVAEQRIVEVFVVCVSCGLQPFIVEF